MIQTFLHGPFHRLASPTQAFEVMLKQVKSGEIWGTTSRYGSAPAVKAYDGTLPSTETGIEFRTLVPPTSRNSMNGQVAWNQGAFGVSDRDFDQIGNRQYVAIRLEFHKIFQKR